MSKINYSQIKNIIYFGEKNAINIAFSEAISNKIDEMKYNQILNKNIFKIPVLVENDGNIHTNYFQSVTKINSFIKNIIKYFNSTETLFILIFDITLEDSEKIIDSIDKNVGIQIINFNNF